MPIECEYKGLYLCPGQVSDEKFEQLLTLHSQQPDNKQINEALELCKQTFGRPNQEDIDDACDFAREKLDI